MSRIEAWNEVLNYQFEADVEEFYQHNFEDILHQVKIRVQTIGNFALLCLAPILRILSPKCGELS